MPAAIAGENLHRNVSVKVLDRRIGASTFLPPLNRSLLRDLLTPLRRHILSPLLAASAAHFRRRAGQLLVALILDLASDDLADQDSQAYRVGWAFFSAWAFRHHTIQTLGADPIKRTSLVVVI